LSSNWSERYCNGGEFYLYKDALKRIASFSKKNDLKVILYTGYLYEEIEKDIIKNVDVIVDGRYKEELSVMGFPSSSNQRVFVNGKLTNNLDLIINKSTEEV
jgi:hypothetical protein